MGGAEIARRAFAAQRGTVVFIRLRSIGDAILMTPLAAAVKSQRPGWSLTAVLEPDAAAVLAGHPHIDRILPVGRGVIPRLRAVHALRRVAADIAIDLHGGTTAALLTRLSGAQLRVGLEAYRSRSAYDLRLPSPYKGAARSVTLHTVAGNLAIAHALGLDPDPDLRPTIRVSEHGRDTANVALAGVGLDAVSPFIAIHPGATLESKTWPRDRFLEVARRLGEDHAVVWLCPPGTTAPGFGVGRGVALARLDLPTLAGVLARARLVIANDSGPSHMAAALGVATVTIFGSQDPRVWRPLGRRARVLASPLPCAPCAGTHCANPHRLECLDRISVEEVVAQAREALLDDEP